MDTVPSLNRFFSMRWFFLTSALLIMAGAALFSYALTLPIYKTPNAMEQVEKEIESLPHEKRTEEWYRRLFLLQTSHRRFSDCGRGLIAAGVGLFIATLFHCFFRRFERMRRWWVILIFWLGLWAVRLPLTYWYYSYRFERGDYPWWADSIVIPIISEYISWVVGGILSTGLIGAFLVNQRLSAYIRINKPNTGAKWVRAIELWLWLLVLGWCVATGIPGGDEGMVVSCIPAAYILLLLLSTEPVRSTDDANTPSVVPAE